LKRSQAAENRWTVFEEQQSFLYILALSWMERRAWMRYGNYKANSQLLHSTQNSGIGMGVAWMA
jgi:hypothetical protein